ncbi:hypothetical protein niasHS_009311 [Heterodera schachtii]|uniref:Uncharacterized protein n=1 Tax=Heterodera schachtii TaxID=97005 RepID=A0ABD2JBN3_HETSC
MRKENNKNSAASTDSDANAKSGGDASPTAPTEEEGEKISANEQQKEQRKSLDALYAAAREEFDLDMSPLDSPKVSWFSAAKTRPTQINI